VPLNMGAEGPVVIAISVSTRGGIALDLIAAGLMVLFHTILSYPRSSASRMFLDSRTRSPCLISPSGLVTVPVDYYIAKMALPYCYMYCVLIPLPPLVGWLSPPRPVLPIYSLNHIFRYPAQRVP